MGTRSTLRAQALHSVERRNQPLAGSLDTRISLGLPDKKSLPGSMKAQDPRAPHALQSDVGTRTLQQFIQHAQFFLQRRQLPHDDSALTLRPKQRLLSRALLQSRQIQYGSKPFFCVSSPAHRETPIPARTCSTN